MKIVTIKVETLLPLRQTIDFVVKSIKDTRYGKTDEEMEKLIKDFIRCNLITSIQD